MKKKLILCALAASLLLPATKSFAFSDIQGHWAQNSIEKISKVEIMNGYEDGTFKPEKYLSRAEFAVILCNLFKLPDNETGFVDIEYHWARDQIKRAAPYLTEYSYTINGNEIKAFKPDIPLLREDVAVALSHLYNLNATAEDIKMVRQLFTDSNEFTKGFEVFIASTVIAGYLSGYEDGTFRSQAPVRRSEMATIILNALTTYTLTKQQNIDKVKELQKVDEMSGKPIYRGVGERDPWLFPSEEFKWTEPVLPIR